MPPILKQPRLSSPGDGSLNNRPIDLGEEPQPQPHSDLDRAGSQAPLSRGPASPGAGSSPGATRRPRRRL